MSCGLYLKKSVFILKVNNGNNSNKKGNKN